MPYQRSASFSKTPAEIAEEFRSLLSGKTAADLPDLVSATPLFLSVNTKPEDGFRFLSEKKIRACPVFDGESIIGTLDLRDSCAFICGLYHGAHGHGGSAPQPSASASMISDQDIGGIARTRPLATFPSDASLLQVAISLARGSHIVGIMDQNGGLKHVLTQGRLVNFLGNELDCLQLQVKCAMSAPVVAVPSTMLTHEAFSIMAERGISSICIVDSEGEILYNLSSTDAALYFLGGEPFQDLGLMLEDWMAAKQSANAKASTSATIRTCDEDDDLSSVIRRMSKASFHRMWVTRDRKPCGVLSMTDVFSILVIGEEAPEKSECTVS